MKYLKQQYIIIKQLRRYRKYTFITGFLKLLELVETVYNLYFCLSNDLYGLLLFININVYTILKHIRNTFIKSVHEQAWQYVMGS